MAYSIRFNSTNQQFDAKFKDLQIVVNSGDGGLSAYEVAVKNGFEGTEQEWLASLKGEPGAQGPAGADGKDGKDGEPGKDGADGKDGAPGEPGKDGADGKDGYTPLKGIDYYTDADKAEIVSAVLTALPSWEGGSY